MGLCTPHADYYLLAAALRSFFLVIATHLLAGEVDTSTLAEETPVLPRLFWLLRYFNPLNLAWRYYSIFAYRVAVTAAGVSWGKKQVAIINYEAHPCKRPVPYIITEGICSYHVRRLEPSGFLSSQGLLAVAAGYQGVLGVHYALSTQVVSYLPNLTLPLAIFGFFRVMVYPWIASKVYVEAYTYPYCTKGVLMEDIQIAPYKANKAVAFSWALVLLLLVFLAVWPYATCPPCRLLQHRAQFTNQLFYLYLTVSALPFHAALLWQGAKGWSNRVSFFDHWAYKLHTVGFLSLLMASLIVGVEDFIEHNYYRQCDLVP